jgi:hypothetical protein
MTTGSCTVLSVFFIVGMRRKGERRESRYGLDTQKILSSRWAREVKLLGKRPSK